MSSIYDVIIIGAGSVGVPTSMYLGNESLRVLVLDAADSIGQGSNKAAIGGVRATHSNMAKARLCMDSISELASWKDQCGDEIEWLQGGYTFVAYDKPTKKTLQEIVKEQKLLKTGLEWLDEVQLLDHVPHLSPKGLLGGTYASNDGSASPLLTINSFSRRAKMKDVQFKFKEPVVQITTEKGRITGVVTAKNCYHAPIVINAAGAGAKTIGQLTQTDLPVRPNIHEAGVTEPVQRFIDPMVVDTRKISNSSSIYFYQHATGQIIFCLTPDPPIWDRGKVETSTFLPLSARRLLTLVPSLRHIQVRRTWSGYYPMTPDGAPLLGWDQHTTGMLIAAGMCGQGFMLGPGIGKLITRMILQQLTAMDRLILEQLSPYREFNSLETLK